MIQQLGIFCCYAYEDQAYLFDLKKYLQSLERQRLIKLWDDMNILAGSEVESAVYQHLNSAEIILLMVSPSFMASDECQKQMARAMERQERHETLVIPIFLRVTNFQTAPFAKLKSLPTDQKPIVHSKRKNQDEAWYDVAQGIEKVVKDWHTPCKSQNSAGNFCIIKREDQRASMSFWHLEHSGTMSSGRSPASSKSLKWIDSDQQRAGERGPLSHWSSVSSAFLQHVPSLAQRRALHSCAHE